jgi:hypothetical protein
MTEDQIKNIFTYHPPNAGQREVYEKNQRRRDRAGADV